MSPLESKPEFLAAAVDVRTLVRRRRRICNNKHDTWYNPG